MTVPEWLTGLIESAASADGQPPFSDQSLVELRDGRRDLLAIEPDAAAIVRRADTPTPAEAELVVRPSARRQGLGTRLLETLLADDDNAGLLIWAHGDHEDARALAHSHQLEPVRQLLQMRATVPPAAAPRPAAIAAFRPGVDDPDWLRLNALAFASHPEQGSLTQGDLDARLGESWFDAEDFLLLRDDAGELVGFCWLKVNADDPDEPGEFYAVGVDPRRQGEGLGRTLVEAGLHRLAERGVTHTALYVEADNTAAVRLYRAYGFDDYSIDIQYRAP